MLAFLTRNYLLIPCAALQIAVLFMMIRKNLVKEFPLFFWYTVIHLVDPFIDLVAASYSDWAFFYVYWGFEAVDAVLTLVVIQSVFLKVFDSYQTLRSSGLVVFRWATVAFCVFAFVTAAYAPGTKDDQLTQAVFVMEMSIQLLQVGLLLSLFLFSKLFGLAWRHYIYGIILGFGLCATISLIAAALRTQLGNRYHYSVSWVFPVAYVVAVVTWACYLFSKRTVEVSAKPPSSAKLYAWNEALAGLLRR